MISFFPILLNVSALIALTFVHFYWLIGGKTGLKIAFPNNSKYRRRVHHPGKLVLFITTLILVSMIWFCIAQTGSFNPYLNNETVMWGNRVSGIILFLRAIGNFKYVGFTKTFKESDFATLDTYIYSPLFIVMSMCAIIPTLQF